MTKRYDFRSKLPRETTSSKEPVLNPKSSTGPSVHATSVVFPTQMSNSLVMTTAGRFAVMLMDPSLVQGIVLSEVAQRLETVSVN